ncbi:MAG: TRAP transporter small permease subunit [Alphaproteobacteria bacterium]
MASSADTPSEGGGPLGAVDRFVAHIEDAFNIVAASVIFLLMFFMVGEVVGRRLLNSPIPGAIDWIEVSMASFAFLGAAYCQRLGGHIRMELVISNLKGRLLWCIEALATSVAVFYIFVVIHKSFLHFLRAYQIGDSTIDTQLPVWPSKLIVPIALSLLLIRLLIQLFGYFRLIAYPTATPVAIPIIKGVAEHAREEIKDILHEDANRPVDDDRDGPGAGRR